MATIECSQCEKQFRTETGHDWHMLRLHPDRIESDDNAGSSSGTGDLEPIIQEKVNDLEPNALDNVQSQIELIAIKVDEITELVGRGLQPRDLEELADRLQKRFVAFENKWPMDLKALQADFTSEIHVLGTNVRAISLLVMDLDSRNPRFRSMREILYKQPTRAELDEARDTLRVMIAK